MTFTPAELRALAWQTLRPAASLQDALNRLGFIQADPIRAPARAQDLTLMQRVSGYQAGDFERLYPELDAEEDMLPNYGFFPRAVQTLLHPRQLRPPALEQQLPGLSEQVLAFVRQQGEVHPRQVQAQFGAASVGNAWGGQSSASTRALGHLHYSGELRVTRRLSGVRLYAPATHLAEVRSCALPEAERLRRVVLLLARLYAPLPTASLSYLLSLSGYGLPQLRPQLKAAFRQMLGHELTESVIDGVKYVWPSDLSRELSLGAQMPSGVKLIGPFDPLVWDRRRFAHLHGWTYKLEAYTPLPKRQFGYYALPLFQAERAVGWANLSVRQQELSHDVQLLPGVRSTAALRRGLETELERYRVFLGAATLRSQSATSTPTDRQIQPQTTPPSARE